jgi:hypothetical protein
MSDIFEWDDANRSHLARHGVSPEEAEQVLVNNPLDLDPQYVNDEWRFPSVGLTRFGLARSGDNGSRREDPRSGVFRRAEEPDRRVSHGKG